MNDHLLEDITVLDFTSRLPGPLACNLLQNLGAKIIKVERESGDAFNDKNLHQHVPSFKDWYLNLNANKEITILKNLKVKEVDIILCPDHEKIINLIKDSNISYKAMITLSGGVGEWRSLHDLNALGLSDTFKLHLKESKKPPYLPFAGISYGQYLATAMLAALYKNHKENITVMRTIYLKNVIEHIFNLFSSHSFEDKPEQLHNGAFVGYNLYQSKDHKTISLAAIEEKYWDQFLETFDIPLKTEDRFSTSVETFTILENKFAKYDADAIRQIIQNKDLCLTIIE